MRLSKKPQTILRGRQSGFAPLIAILIVVILIVAGGAGYYFYLSRDEVLRDKTSQEQKEISCTINSDCGADVCQQERDKCVEKKYVCENGKCSSISKEYADYSCAKDYYGGINFTGGTILEVEYKKVRPEIQVIAEKLADLFESISIQPTGEKGIILKMKHIDEATHQQVLQRLGEVEEKYFESVRGTIDYSKCVDTCGDDICRLPETKDWCPEDCPNQSEQVLDETADWKVYRNDKYGFAVKYPSYFRLGYITSLGDPELEKIDDLNKGLPSFKGVPEDDGLNIHVMAFNSLLETSDEPWEMVFTKKDAREERQKLEQSVIGDPWQFRSEKPYGKVIGILGRKAAQCLKFSPQWGGYNAYFITYNNNGDRIELSIYLKSLTKEEAEKETRNVVFEQILSTFKFIK